MRIETLRLPAPDTQSIVAAATGRPVSFPVVVRPKWTGMATEGGFEAFICKSCGYSELYAHGFEKIEPDDKLGVQLIDNRPPTTLR